jgi:hypothetical protein
MIPDFMKRVEIAGGFDCWRVELPLTNGDEFHFSLINQATGCAPERYLFEFPNEDRACILEVDSRLGWDEDTAKSVGRILEALEIDLHDSGAFNEESGALSWWFEDSNKAVKWLENTLRDFFARNINGQTFDFEFGSYQPTLEELLAVWIEWGERWPQQEDA